MDSSAIERQANAFLRGQLQTPHNEDKVINVITLDNSFQAMLAQSYIKNRVVEGIQVNHHMYGERDFRLYDVDNYQGGDLNIVAGIPYQMKDPNLPSTFQDILATPWSLFLHVAPYGDTLPQHDNIASSVQARLNVVSHLRQILDQVKQAHPEYYASYFRDQSQDAYVLEFIAHNHSEGTWTQDDIVGVYLSLYGAYGKNLPYIIETKGTEQLIQENGYLIPIHSQRRKDYMTRKEREATIAQERLALPSGTWDAVFATIYAEQYQHELGFSILNKIEAEYGRPGVVLIVSQTESEYSNRDYIRIKTREIDARDLSDISSRPHLDTTAGFMVSDIIIASSLTQYLMTTLDNKGIIAK